MAVEIDYLDVKDADRERLRAMGEAIRAFGDAIGSSFIVGFKYIQDVLAQIKIMYWEAYREAGMPYGESDEGMMTWVQNMSEIRDLRDRADEKEEEIRFLAGLRAKAKEMKQ
jgi:hypothetical protein